MRSISGDVVAQRKKLNSRIKDLKQKLNVLQDQRVDNKIGRADYDQRKKEIMEFIEEAKEELKHLDVTLDSAE